MEGIHERRILACLKVKTNIGVFIVFGTDRDVVRLKRSLAGHKYPLFVKGTII